MIDQESYKLLLQKIVDVHYPDESVAFKLGGDEITSQAMKVEQITNQEKRDPYLVGDWVKPVLDIVVVAITGWKIILEIRKLKKEAENDKLVDLQTDLVKMMADEGIKRTKAKSIAKDFFKELELIIEKK